MAVIAIEKGYYAGRIIEAGEPVPLAKGEKPGLWMKVIDDPLDHDGDGRKGGSKPKVKDTPPDEVIPPAEPGKSSDPITGDEI